jgi:hypothetical protein
MDAREAAGIAGKCLLRSRVQNVCFGPVLRPAGRMLGWLPQRVPMHLLVVVGLLVWFGRRRLFCPSGWVVAAGFLVRGGVRSGSVDIASGVVGGWRY